MKSMQSGDDSWIVQKPNTNEQNEPANEIEAKPRANNKDNTLKQTQADEGTENKITKEIERSRDC